MSPGVYARCSLRPPLPVMTLDLVMELSLARDISKYDANGSLRLVFLESLPWNLAAIL